MSRAGERRDRGRGSMVAPSPTDDGFTDTSLVRPVATRVYFVRVFRLVPAWLTANFITLLGFAAMAGMFGLALASGAIPHWVLAFAAFAALQAYVVADHLDGMQALASGTASALGEFLDHYSDSVSGMFLTFVVLELMPGLGEAVRASVLWLYLLAFIVTYQERAEHRRLHFARFGALEGILVVSVFLLTSAFPWGRAFWLRPLVAGLLGYWLIVVVAYTVLGGTVVVILRRIGRVPGSFAAHAGASAVLAVGATLGVRAGALDAWLAWALVSAHGAGYLATVMQPHLFGGRPRVDVPSAAMAVLFLAAAVAAPTAWVQGAAFAVLAWLVLRAVRWVGVVLRTYREGWVWRNPAP